MIIFRCEAKVTPILVNNYEAMNSCRTHSAIIETNIFIIYWMLNWIISSPLISFHHFLLDCSFWEISGNATVLSNWETINILNKKSEIHGGSPAIHGQHLKANSPGLYITVSFRRIQNLSFSAIKKLNDNTKTRRSVLKSCPCSAGEPPGPFKTAERQKQS